MFLKILNTPFIVNGLTAWKVIKNFTLAGIFQEFFLLFENMFFQSAQ